MMKKMIAFINRLFIGGLVLVLVFCLSGCGNSNLRDGDFIIPTDKTGTALTIGWYVPVENIAQLVGPGFKPKVVNDKGQSFVSIFIVKSEQHKLDGQQMGDMKAAHLVIPVERPESVGVDDWKDIASAMVCPVNIVEKSEILGDKYVEYGFSTYTGTIILDVKQTENKYMVQAEINTVNGQIAINGMFELEGKEIETSSAMFTHKNGTKNFFYGEERMTRIKDGKGNLQIEGDNLVKALGLSSQPFILRLDRNISWEFDFVKK